jgi:hypothetical protein
VLHRLAVKVSGHTAPLPTVGLSTPRVRDAVPPPHVTEQVAQLDQAPTVQSSTCIEGEPDGTAVIGSVGVGVVGLGVGEGVGEGVGFDVGAGVGVDVGTVGATGAGVAGATGGGGAGATGAGVAGATGGGVEGATGGVGLHAEKTECSMAPVSAQCVVRGEPMIVCVCGAGCRDLRVSSSKPVHVCS